MRGQVLVSPVSFLIFQTCIFLFYKEYCKVDITTIIVVESILIFFIITNFVLSLFVNLKLVSCNTNYFTYLLLIVTACSYISTLFYNCVLFYDIFLSKKCTVLIFKVYNIIYLIIKLVEVCYIFYIVKMLKNKN